MSQASKDLQFIPTPLILMQGGSISSTIHMSIPDLGDGVAKIRCQKESGHKCGQGGRG